MVQITAPKLGHEMTIKHLDNSLLIKYGALPVLSFIFLILFSAVICFFPDLLLLFSLFLFFAVIFFLFPKPSLLIFGIFISCQALILSFFPRESFPGSIFVLADELFILLSFIVTIIKITFDDHTTLEKTPFDFPFFLLILVALLSSGFARLASLTTSFFDLFILMKGFLLFYIFYYTSFNEKDVRLFLFTFFLFGFFILILGFADSFFGQTFKYYFFDDPFIDRRAGLLSVSSIWPHPGEFGWFMSFISCYLIAFYFIFSKKNIIALFLLFLSGVVISMRVKAIISTFLSVAIGYLFQRNSPFIKGMSIVFSFVILFLLFGDELLHLLSRQFSTYLFAYDPSKVPRNALYLTAFKIAADYFPFGTGLGTFGGYISYLYYSSVYTKYGLSDIYGLSYGGSFICDTFWAYIIGQFGFLGTLLYFLVIYRLYRMIINAFYHFKSPFLKAYSLGTFLAFTESLIESVAYPIYLKVPSLYFIFGALGILAYLSKHNGQYNV